MHNKIKGKIMNQKNVLLIIVLLSFLLAIPAVFAEVFAAQNSSQPPLKQKQPSVVVKKIPAANEAIKTQKTRIKAESVKPEEAVAKNNDRFIPTETISEDLSVSFPTDI